jgi:hypothetical protein
MPITLDSVTLEYKSLPLLLREDGTAQVVMRKGYVLDGSFIEISRQTLEISAEDVSAVLDAEPLGKMTRRDDLSLALYTRLVQLGLVEAGAVS